MGLLAMSWLTLLRVKLEGLSVDIAMEYFWRNFQDVMFGSPLTIKVP